MQDCVIIPAKEDQARARFLTWPGAFAFAAADLPGAFARAAEEVAAPLLDFLTPVADAWRLPPDLPGAATNLGDLVPDIPVPPDLRGLGFPWSAMLTSFLSRV